MRLEKQRRDEFELADDGDRSERATLQALALGASGGFVATFVMTAFRLPISRSLPPTAEFWTTYVRPGEPDEATLPAILLHFIYGMGAGVVYVVAAPDFSNASEAGAEGRGVVTAVAYSLLLSAFGLRVVLGTLLDQELSPDEKLIFHLGHVVYGVTLGAWLGSRATD